MTHSDRTAARLRKRAQRAQWRALGLVCLEVWVSPERVNAIKGLDERKAVTHARQKKSEEELDVTVPRR